MRFIGGWFDEDVKSEDSVVCIFNYKIVDGIEIYCV